jgi:hypothetical protein
MENCIVTKLKGVISNDLRKLGEARIKVNSLSSELLDPNGNSQKLIFGIKANETVKIKIIGEGHLSTISFADLDTSTLTEKTFVGGNVNRLEAVYFSVGNYAVSILNKYNIYELQVERIHGTILNYIFEYDMSEFYYSGLTNLYLRESVFSNFDDNTFLNTHDKFERFYLSRSKGTSNIYNATLETIVSHIERTTQSRASLNIGGLGVVTGDISALEGAPIDAVYIYDNPDLTGNISVFGTIPNLSQLQFNGCPNLYGTIESIVKNWVTVCGVTSGATPDALRFTASPLITFNGVQARPNKILSWTSDGTNISITYGDVTVSVPIN